MLYIDEYDDIQFTLIGDYQEEWMAARSAVCDLVNKAGQLITGPRPRTRYDILEVALLLLRDAVWDSWEAENEQVADEKHEFDRETIDAIHLAAERIRSRNHAA